MATAVFDVSSFLLPTPSRRASRPLIPISAISATTSTPRRQTQLAVNMHSSRIEITGFLRRRDIIIRRRRAICRACASAFANIRTCSIRATRSENALYRVRDGAHLTRYRRVEIIIRPSSGVAPSSLPAARSSIPILIAIRDAADQGGGIN